MKVTLSVTHNCNLACAYCYAGKKFKKDMTLETARQAVDFVLAGIAPGAPLEFGFFGGEPLLKFKLIKQIVAYLREKEQQYARRIEMQVTTNGTLLTPEILKYIKQENIGLCLSIDGPRHIHDKVRRYRNGKSTFNRVLNNLQRAVDSRCHLQVNAVYSADTIAALPETVDFLVNQGIVLIHLNPNIHADWQGLDFTTLSDSYQNVAKHYIDYYRQGREIAVNQVDSKIIVFLKGGYDATDRCGMGETEFGIAPSGNIYPCERFIGEDLGGEHCIGNVYTGIERACQCQVVKGRGNVNPECGLCSLQKYCMNWCGCTNHAMTGKTNYASSFLCASEKASMHAAQQVLTELQDNTLFTDHFYRYLVKDSAPLAEAV